MIRDMTTPSPAERMFTASSAAKACGVGRSTVHRYLEQGRLPGAEQDRDGVWQIPLSALLSVGWTPGRSAPSVDTAREHDRDDDRDTARPVSFEVHQLTVELERARAEALAQKIRADGLEQAANAYWQRQLEQAKPSQTAPGSPQAGEQASPELSHAPVPDRPSTGRLRRAWNVLRY